jgi:hypothetical protein
LNKRFSAAISIAIALMFTSGLVVTVLGQGDIVPPEIGTIWQLAPDLEISMRSFCYSQPAARIGIGQPLLTEALLTPPPSVPVNVTLYYTAPNMTNIYCDYQGGGFTGDVTWTQDPDARLLLDGGGTGLDIFEFYCTFYPDAVGQWTLTEHFDGITVPGDATYLPRTETAGRPIYVQAEPVTMPPTSVVTRSYCSVNYPKVGTGSAVYIIGWVQPPRELLGGIFHHEMEFTVTKPNGQTVTESVKMDSPATAGFSLTCDVAGEWSATSHFVEDDYILFKYLESDSPAVYWTVEDGFTTPVYPDMPLPTYPWKFPINGDYHSWFQISGPWPQSSAIYNDGRTEWNPYTKGPNSAHVIWARGMEGSIAGIIGGAGTYGGGNDWFGTTTFPGFLVWQGVIYYSTGRTIVKVDQLTGEEIMRKEMSGSGSISRMILQIEPRVKADPRQTERPGGTTQLICEGSNKLWIVQPDDLSLSYYNSTWPDPCTSPSGAGENVLYYDQHLYNIYTNNTDGYNYCLKWSINDRQDIWRIPMTAAWRTGHFIDDTVDPPRLVQIAVSLGSWPFTTTISSWELETGKLIEKGKAITGFYATEGAPNRALAYEGNLYYHGYDRALWAISSSTGEVSWVSEPQSYPWGGFNAYNMAAGYGLIFANGWDGWQYVYDANDGELVFRAFSGESMGETGFGNYSWWGYTIVGDYKAYTATGQHTQPQPPSRGDALYCVDLETGSVKWKLDNFQEASSCSLAYGVLTYGNQYDGRVYAFSQGPTATAVEGPKKSVSLGDSVVITGSVLDMSPGAPNIPCVSDADQNEWMQWVYQNAPKPTDATGVVVHLEYVAPDGTVNDMTHVTTDLNGDFGYLWTPPDEGLYTVVATMDPTDSYYSSSDTTYVGVGPAAAAPSEPEAAPDNSAILYGVIAAIVIGIIAIVLIVIVLMRK